MTIDGADEFDPALNLIKGGGGAMLREKIVAFASRQLVVVTDSSKQVPVLGKFPLPVEVIGFAEPLVAKKISDLGAKVVRRLDSSGKPTSPMSTITSSTVISDKLPTLPPWLERSVRCLGLWNMDYLSAWPARF